MQPDRQQQLNELWLESLLTAAYQPDDRAEDRVADVMRALDKPVKAQAVRGRWYSLRNISALAIAASLLLLVTLVFDNSQQRAYATVARSAQAVPQTRHYRMQMIAHRPAVGRREMNADLYIDPTNQFVMKHPAMLGFGTVWIGGDAQHRWIAPPRGPVIVGGEEIVGRWLSGQDLVSPYLHLNTILERMGQEYSLTMLEDVALNGLGDRPVLSQHVRGDIRQLRGWMPSTIELWADIESGVAQKVILSWPPHPNRPGPVRWTIELIDTPSNLPNDWFEISGHAAGRPIVRARTNSDLEQNVNQDSTAQ